MDKIIFGSESNDPAWLMTIAKTIYKNQAQYDRLLKTCLKAGGNSFSKSASLALKFITNTEVSYLNDILGLEYCKAIVSNHYDFETHTLKRTVAQHSMKPHRGFALASYIR